MPAVTDDLARYADFTIVRFDRPAAHVLRMTLDNPAARNALTRQMHVEVVRALRLVEDDAETRVIIVTGAGKAFCAGGDFAEMPNKLPYDINGRFSEGFGDARELIAAIINCTRPIVSAINGAAVGAGLALALLADIPIAAKQAKLFDAHLRIGVVPGDHAAMIWPLLCGLAKAKYYLLTNEILTGEEAERINLVALAVEAEELQDKAISVATKLAQTAPTALRMSKYALNHYLRQNQTVLDLSLAFEMVNFGSDESEEAMRAMEAGEAPRFKPAQSRFR
jgi:enoyl-CoA hydratase